MNNKLNLSVASITALAVGLLLGWQIKTVERPSTADSEVARPTASAERPAPDESALNRLRSRVKDLERQLAEAQRQPEPPAAQPAEPA